MIRALGAALVALTTTAAAQAGAVAEAVRFATFNAALVEDTAGALLARLEGGADEQARLVAEVIQRVRPDVLLLQELDRDAEGRSLAVLRAEYLAVGQGGAAAIDYPHILFPPSNTGVPSGVDLDGDGVAAGPQDAKGFGRHHGHYAFALLSRYPLTATRTFRTLLWRDMPGARVPPGYYSDAALAVLPLSSKTHLLAEVATPQGAVHVLAAHPTPPVFDDEAIDWNGRRNADEIRLLADLLDARTSAYAVDDAGMAAGGIAAGAGLPRAVVMGDLNADPVRGESLPGAIDQLLGHRMIRPVEPRSARGTATAEFGGGLRVDYVLPTTALEVVGSGVFWPAEDHPLARLNAASDHRLVWVDVRVAPPDRAAGR